MRPNRLPYGARTGRGPALTRDASVLEERQRVGLAINAAARKEINDSSFDSANRSRQGACRPPNRRDPGKHSRFCNPERPGAEFIAGVVAA